MDLRQPFRCLEPTFCSGLLDDPVLLLRVRPRGRNLLVDCGQIHHLAKRVLKAVEAIFISHAHMDHFMGIDTFVRNVHVSPRTFDLYGPPGLAGKLAHKLAAYDWNLTEDYWCSFRVHEIGPGKMRTFLLPGPEGFVCRPEGERERPAIIFEDNYLQAAADLGDHKIPALFFRFTEKPAFGIDEDKIAARGLEKGPWLKDLKRLFYRGELERGTIRATRQDGNQEEFPSRALYEKIGREETPASLGYLTDVGFTRENRDRIGRLLAGVTILVCECTYLKKDLEKARLSYHLCTEDVNTLARELRPAYLLPIHLSKGNIGRSETLYEELRMPPGVTLLRLPEHIPPRPLLPSEIPGPAEPEQED